MYPLTFHAVTDSLREYGKLTFVRDTQLKKWSCEKVFRKVSGPVGEMIVSFIGLKWMISIRSYSRMQMK